MVRSFKKKKSILGKRPRKVQETPCYAYDITIGINGTTRELILEQRKAIIKELKLWCKKWGMQLERGENPKEDKEGYLHYQVRVSLIKKDRASTLMTKWMETPLKGHISITSTANMNDWSYIQKAQTRIEGPWRWDDKEIQEKPKDLIGKELRPWQSHLEWLAKQEPDDRKIQVIIDTKGGAGKSWFCKYMCFNHNAIYVPPFEDTVKMMGWIQKSWDGNRTANVFMIDMPRGMWETKKTQEMWTAIETLKGGVAYDARYKPEQIMMSPPHVWVFCNKKPNLNYLSIDRWDFLKTDPNDFDESEQDLDDLYKLMEEELSNAPDLGIETKEEKRT